MMVKDLGQVVGDHYQNIEQLRERSIISLEDARIMNELNGLRNRLAHDYNGIIAKTALDSIRKTIDIAITFKEKVKAWLNKK